MSDQREIYERDREDPYYEGRHTHRKEGFFERNCDEAWEQVKETFSHPGRLFAKVLLIALVCGVVAGGSYLLKIRAPELPSKGDGSKNNNTEQTDGIDYGDGVRPKAGGERKSKGFYTVLILGRDTGGGGNTDTMLLASYDVTNQKATVMSIPRDTMVNVPWDIKKINSVYNYYGGGDKGIKALYKEIAQLVGFEPDYQVVLEWDAVGEIVDAMGGVYYDVPRNMSYDDPYQDLHIHQTKGYRKLSGSDVMQVLRYRHDNDMRYGYPDGDLGRIKTQQTLLKAMIEQLLQLKNVTKIGDFARAVKNNVTSDLTFEEMLWFGSQAVMGGLTIDSVNFVTMPNTGKMVYSRSIGGMLSYVVPNAQELLNLVNNELSPFVETFTMRDLDIMSVNADGSVSSSTGHVEDSKAAVPPTLMGSGKKDEPEKDYITDENGNLIDPDTGEIVSPPEETKPGTETPSEPTPETPATPETPGTGTETTDPSGSTGGETGTGSPETPDQPEDPGIIVVPPEEPATPDANQGLDPVTGEPLPMGG